MLNSAAGASTGAYLACQQGFSGCQVPHRQGSLHLWWGYTWSVQMTPRATVLAHAAIKQKGTAGNIVIWRSGASHCRSQGSPTTSLPAFETIPTRDIWEQPAFKYPLPGWLYRFETTKECRGYTAWMTIIHTFLNAWSVIFFPPTNSLVSCLQVVATCHEELIVDSCSRTTFTLI